MPEENELKSYKIETLNDMMQIPLERFNVFLSEMTQALYCARIAHAYNQAVGGTEPTIRKPFIWIDDGKGEIRTNITWKAKGEGKE